MNKIDKLIAALKYDQALVFSGAGVSTNSGIADFRGENGFYNKYHEDDLAIDAFFRDTDQFYIAFQEKFNKVFTASPNDTHFILAQLEKVGFVKGIITQNVDRLHQKAGSKNVIEFHGNIFTYDLIQKSPQVPENYKIIENDIPYHSLLREGRLHYRLNDQQVYKPHVVLYGEPINGYDEAAQLAKTCNVHIIIGTSFLVSPFNTLSYENTSQDLKVFVINKEAIRYHPYNHAEVVQIIGDTSEILKEIKKRLAI